MADESGGAPPQRTTAEMHKGRWPGWIWAAPIAAVAIVIWLIARQLSARGVEVTVTFDDAAQMKAGSTQVIYRGIQMGEVSGVSLSKDGSKAITKLRIHRDARKYLNAGTRFYLEGAKLSLSDPASLKGLISGPTIQMMPGGGAPARSFAGLEGEAPKRLAVAIPYRVVFRQSAGGLRPGAPVTLRGFEVGEVTAVELEVDSRAADVRSRVDIALDPSRFHVEGGAPADGNWIPVMNDIVKSLVAHRWRARLRQSPPLVGSREVELAEVPDAPAATLQVSNGSAEIPAAEGGGIEHLIQAAGQFPLREIGDNVRDITEHVKTLVASRRLQDSIAHIDSAVAQLDRTLHQAGPKVAPTIQSVHDTVDQLRQAAGELDSTIKDARALMGTDASAPDGSLEPTLRNVSDAARAVRVLADYLDEHPESLVRGRLR